MVTACTLPCALAPHVCPCWRCTTCDAGNLERVSCKQPSLKATTSLEMQARAHSSPGWLGLVRRRGHHLEKQVQAGGDDLRLHGSRHAQQDKAVVQILGRRRVLRQPVSSLAQLPDGVEGRRLQERRLVLQHLAQDLLQRPQLSWAGQMHRSLISSFLSGWSSPCWVRSYYCNSPSAHFTATATAKVSWQTR